MTTSRISAIRTGLIVIIAVGLLIDTFVHFDLASAFKNNRTDFISEATIFRIDAVLALVAAIALVVRPRRYTAGFAFLVAAADTVAVILFRYVNVGKIGPLPNMYDPYWAPAGKTISAIGELVAAVAALALVLLLQGNEHRAASVSTSAKLRLRHGH